MAAIEIRAQLTEADIKRAAGEMEATFKRAFDNIGEHARGQMKRIFDSFGGEGNFRRATQQLTQLKDAEERATRQALQLAQAQARLVAATGDAAGAQRVLSNALQSAQKELKGAEHESLAFLRASTQLANAQKRLGSNFDETGRKGRVASEIIREGFSEVLEELIKDGSVANELTKAFFAMPVPARIALGVIATGAIAAAVAIVGIVAALRQVLDVAEKVGTKNRDDFNEFAKAVRGAGGEVTNLDRAMSQELLRSADKVKGAFDNLFIVILRQTGPEMIALFNQVARLLIQLAPLAQQFGVFLARSIAIGNAALTTFINNAGKAAGALATLFAPRNPFAGTAGTAQRILSDVKAVKDLASIGSDFDANLQKAIRDAENIRTQGFKPATFDSKGGAAAARQERAALLAEVRAGLQKELQEYQQFARDRASILQEERDNGIKSTKQYFAERLSITTFEFDNIVDITQREAAAIEATRAKVKAGVPEEIRLRKELLEVYADGERKLMKLTAEVRRNALEFKKAFALPADVDLTRQEGVTPTVPLIIQQARERLRLAGAAGRSSEEQEVTLRLKEVEIQNQIVRGVLTETEGRSALLAVQRQYRDVLIQAKEIQLDTATGIDAERLRLEIEQLQTLGLELDNGTRFARGFGSEIEAVGDIFERFGSNVARALTNVKDLFNSLKRAVLDFFNDILGNALQNLLKGTFNSLGGLFGNVAGGAAGGARGGGGNVFSQIANSFSNLFRTPGINPNALLGAGAAPVSVTGGLPRLPGVSIPGLDTIFGNPGTGAGAVSRGAFGAGGLFGSAFSALLGPGLLGGILGSSLGGQSTLGRILGGVGGGLLGGALGLGGAIFASGGSLAATLGPLLGVLGPAAAIAGPILLVGAILAGRAKARRQDEATSGDYLTDAINKIRALRKDVVQDRVVGESEARKIFDSEILGTFIQQIQTIKTRSVRESRLKNQTADLKALFEKEVIPAVIEQATRRIVAEKLIPEFATGGFHRGIGFALLHDREIILNQRQQAALTAVTSPTIFQQIGVPNVPHSGPFENGGVYRAGGGALNVSINVGSWQITEKGALELLDVAISTEDGRRKVIGVVQTAALRARG